MTDKQPADDLDLMQQDGAPENEADLLSDFQDLLGDEAETIGEAAKAPAEDDDLNLQELEAFLDDFSNDGADETGAAEESEEPAADASGVWEDEPQLYSEEDFAPAADETEILPDPVAEEAVALGDDAVAPDTTEQEQPLELGADELDLAVEDGAEEPEDAGFEQLDLDAIAVPPPAERSDNTDIETTAAHDATFAAEEYGADQAEGPPDELEIMGEPPAAPAPAAPPAPVAAAAGDGRRFIMAAALAGVGLLLAAGAGLMAMNLGGEVERLNQSLAEVQSRAGTRGTAAGDPRAEEALREVRRLEARLSELAIIIEGPMSHLREANERDIHNLAMRLDAMESSLDELKKGRPLVASAPPAAVPAKPASAKPAPTAAAKPAAASAGPWVVNLVSLSEAGAAAQEQARLRRFGIEAVLQRVTVDGRTWHRLRVTGFGSREAAQDYLDRVSGKARLSGAWVTRG